MPLVTLAALAPSPASAQFPTMSSLTLDPATVQGGNVVTGTVTLTAAAPTGDVNVFLSSSNPGAVSVPPFVTVPGGTSSEMFPINANAVNTTTTAVITAELNGELLFATLTVSPGAPPPPVLTVTGLTLNPASVVGGESTTAILTLSGAAPGGGAIVALTTSDPAVATVPGSITVDEGNTSANFTVATRPVSTSATVSIAALFGATTQTAALAVNPPAPGSGPPVSGLVVYQASTQQWVLRDASGNATTVTFGAPGDRPLLGDFLAAGSPQLAVFRPSTGEWLIRNAAEWLLRTDPGGTVRQQWGALGDQPVPADYFGLGRAQIAVFRPATAEWFLRNDQDQATQIGFGTVGDVPLPADYRAAGRAQLGVYNADTAEWLVRADNGASTGIHLGTPFDVPVSTNPTVMLDVLP
jgi:hypothetical protein